MKIKLFFTFFVLLFSSLSLLAQEKNDTIQNNEQKWTIGASVAPVITFYTKKNNDADRVYPFEKKLQQNYGASVIVGYKLRDHIRLESGISYDVLQYQLRLNVVSSDKKYLYRSICVPLILEKTIQNKKLFFNFGGGIQEGFFLSRQSILINNGVWVTEFRDNSRSITMLIVKGGMGYNLKNNVNIFLNAKVYSSISTIQYEWTNLYGDPSGDTYRLKYFTINFGITYAFSK